MREPKRLSASPTELTEALDDLVRLEEALGIASQKNDIARARKLRDKADASRRAVEDLFRERSQEIEQLDFVLSEQTDRIASLKAELSERDKEIERLREEASGWQDIAQHAERSQLTGEEAAYIGLHLFGANWEWRPAEVDSEVEKTAYEKLRAISSRSTTEGSE